MHATDPLLLCSGRLDPVRRVLHRDGDDIRLTQKELDLLLYLTARESRVVPREELLGAVWGYGPQVRTRTLDTTIARLRRKIEPNPAEPVHILTSPGRGYLFCHANQAAEPPLGPIRTSFVGRQPELARIGDALAEPSRQMAIVGPPGLGKTRLATRWAFRNVPDPERLMCDLASVSTGPQLFQVLEDALGLPDAGGDRAARVGDALARSGVTLLLLDNADAIPAEVDAAAAAWVARAPALRVLVTSRSQLPTMPSMEPPPLPTADGVLLFVERATSGPGDADADVLRRLVERLDGLPLAIEMAAARARLLSPAQILSHLDDRFRLLRFPTDTPGARARTLLEAIRWSWELLDPAEQRALAWLSIFAGTFSPVAAEQLLDASGLPDPLDRLCNLEGAGLLQVIQTEDAGHRLRLWENLRAFAAENLARSGERDACARAFLTLCVGAVEPDAPDRVAGRCSPRDDIALREAHNLRVAMEHGLRDAPEDAARLLLSILGHPSWRRAETSAWLDSPVFETLPDPLLARLLMYRADAHFQAGRVDSAAALLEEALPVAERLGDADTAGRVLVQMSELQMRQGGFAEARSCLDVARQRFEEGAPIALIRVFDAQAMLAHCQGQHEEAQRWRTEALTHAQRHGLEYYEMTSRSGLASGLSELGRPHEAEPHARRALAYFERISDHRRIANMLHLLAVIALKQGLLSKGATLLDAAGDAYGRAADPRGEALILVCQSDVVLALAGPDRAAPLLREARARLDSIREHRLGAITAAHLAAIEAERGALDEAEDLLRLARPALAGVGWAAGHVLFAEAWIDVVRAERSADAPRLRQRAGAWLSTLEASPVAQRPVDFVLARLRDRLVRPPRHAAMPAHAL
ncbi:MAG: winged helix-turn-helix domain-containing protein [Alphaproteobacteria bacterium]|nr:winged helix-turn-helix domain-containing protein [Alphaproteobacteria bacterium]